MITCTFCDAENPTEAVFCAACGEPFYRAEKWSLPFYHYEESRGRVNVKLRFRNAGVGVLYPRALVSLDESFEIALPDAAGIDTNSWREFDIDRLDLDGTNGSLENLACRCDLQYEGRDTFLIPAPPLRIGPRPDVVLRVGDRYVFDAEGTLITGSSGDDGALTLPIRPSTQYAVRGHIDVRNDTTTRIRSVSLSTGEGRTVRRYDGDGKQATGFDLRLPPNLHKELDSPDTYSVAVDVDGVDMPIAFSFQPAFFGKPTLQVFVERPTRAGRAYVGLEDRKLEDVSPKRLAGESRARGLESSRRDALQSDALVQSTLEGLQHAQPEIRWSVPKGKARTKHIAIDRRSPENGDDAFPPDDQLEFVVTVVLGEQSNEHGPFQAQGRRQVPVPIPALETDATGRLQVTYVGRNDVAFEVALRVDVAEPNPFPIPVAVDFGTTNSCIALSVPEKDRKGGFIPDTNPASTFLVPVGRLHTDDNSSSTSPVVRSAIVPTRIYQTGDGALTMDASPDRTAEFRSFKTALHLSEIDSEDEEARRPPSELAQAFLKQVMRRTADFLEERGVPSLLQNVTCTLPTTFSRSERDVITTVYRHVQAAEGVDDGRQIEIDESMAAFYFQRICGLEQDFRKHRSTGVFLLVYDFGGGTTDVTALYAHWQSASGRGGRWRYAELAAGGNPNLGGDDVTDWLAQGLFGSVEAVRTAGIDFIDVETIKHNLDSLSTKGPIGRETIRKQITRALQKDDAAEDGPVSEEEARDRAYQVKDEILEQLGDEGEAILEDVFRKSFQRLQRLDGVDASQPLPIFLLLAGNGSRLAGFQDTLETSARAALDACPAAPDASFARVELVKEPKACVAKGAYLSEGTPPDVDAPFRPYVSYWLKLPLDAMPAESMTSFMGEDGRYFVELIPEGTAPPVARDVPADAVGVFGSGTYSLHERRGVAMDEVDRFFLHVPPDGDAVLDVRSDDGVSIEVRDAAAS